MYNKVCNRYRSAYVPVFQSYSVKACIASSSKFDHQQQKFKDGLLLYQIKHFNLNQEWL